MEFPSNWLSPKTIEAMYEDVTAVWHETSGKNVRRDCADKAKELEKLYRDLTGENLYKVLANQPAAS